MEIITTKCSLPKSERVKIKKDCNKLNCKDCEHSINIKWVVVKIKEKRRNKNEL